MAASGGRFPSSSPPPPPTSPEVFQWLKNLPLAPEYHPTISEFQDPISYIFKIEQEASKFGICKIVPPVLPSPKKTAISNFNRSLETRPGPPTFTTRRQQIGFCPRRPRPVQKPVWKSGESYTFHEFEAKAKSFERNYLRKCSKKGAFSALEIETLFWKATLDKPFCVEYANDMPGSGFAERKIGGFGGREEGVTVGETEWNMRGVSRAKGSLLRFMREEIPGVTSPMVYVAMLFSWFAWHVEDHDLHSLNYLHMGAGKTWYGVPKEAAAAFEEVVRVHGYGGEINPLVTFAVLGEKTTVMSPEIFISAGVPCCRLVQNAGEFVVTFPRAYHSGFSHGFNCGEAANIATPEWLRFAKDSAIRRASINYPPMVSHFQLLYDLAIELCTRIPVSISAKPRSSRLKDKQKGEGEALVKELFVKNVMQNNKLLHSLGNGSPIVLLPPTSSDISVSSNLRVGSRLRVNHSLALHSHMDFMKSLKSSVSESTMPDVKRGTTQATGIYSVKGKFDTLNERNRLSSLNGNENTENANAGTEGGNDLHGDKLADQRLFSCVTCGILSFDCVAIVQPREAAARYLMSADCSFFNDWIVGSAVTTDGTATTGGGAYASDPTFSTRLVETTGTDGFYDNPVQAVGCQVGTAVQNNEATSNSKTQKQTSALGLLASTYGNSSDSDDDQVDPDASHCTNEINLRNPSVSKHQSEDSALSSLKQECDHVANASQIPSPSRSNCENEVSFQTIDVYAMDGRKVANFKGRNDQTNDHSVDFETRKLASVDANSLEGTFRDQMSSSHTSSYYSPVVHDTEETKFSRGVVPMENAARSFAQRSDEDSSRIHVFCLEHAVEVEQQLRPIGGVHILLLCHPEYPRIEAEAKLVSEELGFDSVWNDIAFRDATNVDKERIQLALDSEEAIPGNGDWAVKLGINLFYSATLSQSSLYSKQMPYNSVIYNAFGRTSPSHKEFNVYGRRGRQRKVVAGRWCGKVWMSNQVHPFLAKQDSEDQVEEQDQERSLCGLAMPDENLERQMQSIRKAKTNGITRNSGRKRKVTTGSVSVKKVECLEADDALTDDSAEGDFHNQFTRIHCSKRAKGVERELSCDSLEDNSHQQHGRICRNKLAKSFETDDAVSDDSLEDESLQQHKKILRSKETKFIERKNAVSCSVVPQKQHRRIPKSKQAKFVWREGGVSDDSLEDNSHGWHRRIPRSRQAKFNEREHVVSDDSSEESSRWLHGRGKRAIDKEQEDSASDDSLENSSDHQFRSNSRGNRSKFLETEEVSLDDLLVEKTYQRPIRYSRSKQAKFIERADAVSDDSIEYSTRWQQRRILRSKQHKFVDEEDDISDDSLEGSTHQKHGKIPKNKKAKFVESEDAISDHSEGDTTHLRQLKVPRGKKARCTEREDIPSEDAPERDIYTQPRKTRKGKKAKFMEREDAVSNDVLEDNSNQQRRRILRNKPKNTMASNRTQRETSQLVKQGTRRPIKKEPRQLIKQEKQTKRETPRIRNIKTEQNARQFDANMEEDVVRGPSTRLRERQSKHPKDSETMTRAKQQSSRKNAKGASAAKPPAGHKNVKMKVEEGEYQCDIEGCTMSFGSKQELTVHKRNICPVKGCGKKFFSHKYLVQHRRVHLDDRPLKCPWTGCKMTFKWAWARTEHIRVHTGARPYVCSEEGCGQTFRFVSDFSRHKRKTGHSVKKVRG